MQFKKILAVDDSELMHKMYRMMFSMGKWRETALVHALNGKEALALLGRNADVDLILLDINMPVMSGLEFLSVFTEIKAFAQVPVIIVSTESTKEDTVRGLQAGAKAYVTKPFTPDILYNLIEKL